MPRRPPKPIVVSQTEQPAILQSGHETVQKVAAWLLKFTISRNKIILYFKTKAGKLKLEDTYYPYFYVVPENPDKWETQASGWNNQPSIEQISRIISNHPKVFKVDIEDKIPDLEEPETKKVLRVWVDGVEAYREVVRDMKKIPGIALAETQMSHYTKYILSRNLSPMAKAVVEHENGRIVSAENQTSEEMPDLKYILVYRSKKYYVLHEGMYYKFYLLESLRDFIEDLDPDVVVTFSDYPELNYLRYTGCIYLDLRKSLSMDIYADSYEFDSKPSKLLKQLYQASKERMVAIAELSKTTRILPDIAARVTPGRLNTFLHIYSAKEKGLLIPDSKKGMEFPKTLKLLNLVDQGGLIFYPKPGIYQNVSKCDFSSMYPNIIVNKNISMETINCSCCSLGSRTPDQSGISDPPGRGGRSPDQSGISDPPETVPNTDWTICKKLGVIPLGLKHVLERRLKLKKLYLETKEPVLKKEYDIRQRSLKTILVCCLDGETIVPYKQNGELRMGKIRDIIEPFTEGKEGVFKIGTDIQVFGINKDLKTIENKVKNVIKINYPGKHLNIKLEWGRNLTLTDNHLCYILEEGKIALKRADQLKAGDYIPIVSQLPISSEKTNINFLSELIKKLPEEELSKWRVFGNSLKDKIGEQFETLKAKTENEYSLKTICNWKNYGYLPFQIIRDFPVEENGFFIGRGKRDGGIIKKIPASINLDSDLGFFLGFFAGDGSYGGNMIRLDIGINETDVVEKLETIIKEKFNLSASITKEKKANMYVMQINSVALKRILNVVFGLGGSAETGKLEIPPLFLNTNKEFLYGFISGLIASDGYISKVRNFGNIASHKWEYIKKLGIIFSLLGLEYRLTRQNERLHEIQLRGLKDLNLFYQNGWLKDKHKEIIKEKNGKIRSYRNPQFPVMESGLFEVCKKASVASKPFYLGQRERISKSLALKYLAKIDAKKLDTETQTKFEFLKKLTLSNLIFAKILSIEEEKSNPPFVYCFEVEGGLPGFVTEGGIFTHNCFGYLGFKNFIFSNVECKEAVVLFGREILLKAKDIADEMGLEVIYGITDSIFVSGRSAEDHKTFCEKVSKAVGIELMIDDTFPFLVFPSALLGSGVGIANKYFGIGSKGLEARGIYVRHSDSPLLIKEFQTRSICLLLKDAKSPEDVIGNKSKVQDLFEIYKFYIRNHSIAMGKFAILKSIRKPIEKYKVDAPQVVALKQKLAFKGGLLNANSNQNNKFSDDQGYEHHHIEYIYTTGPLQAAPIEMASQTMVDRERYVELLEKARDEILNGVILGGNKN